MVIKRLNHQQSEDQGGRKVGGVGVMKDNEIEDSHTLGGTRGQKRVKSTIVRTQCLPTLS